MIKKLIQEATVSLQLALATISAVLIMVSKLIRPTLLHTWWYRRDPTPTTAHASLRPRMHAPLSRLLVEAAAAWGFAQMVGID